MSDHEHRARQPQGTGRPEGTGRYRSAVVAAAAIACSAGAVVAACATAASADEPFFRTLPTLPGGYWTEAFGVSGDGSTVVGYGDSRRSEQFSAEGFVWTARDGIIGLGDLRGWYYVYSQARAASFDGSIVVGGAPSPRGYEAFVWTREGGMVGLGDFPDRTTNLSSLAYGVSRDGSVIVGRGRRRNGLFEPFRWTPDDGMVSLGSLPGGRGSSARAVSGDGSTIVGVATSFQYPEGVAFRWTEAEGMIGLGVLPGAEYSQAYGVSADGSVVVGISDDPESGGAFRWTADSGMVNLGFVPGRTHWSVACGVSGDGSVVVGATQDVTGPRMAFVWEVGRGMRLLQEVLEQDYGLDLGGVRLESAIGVSADGLTFVGDSTRGAWIARIPEPSALALMLVGAGVVIRRGAGRRRDSSGTGAARPGDANHETSDAGDIEAFVAPRRGG